MVLRAGAMSDRRVADARYAASEKGRARHERYLATERGLLLRAVSNVRCANRRTEKRHTEVANRCQRPTA